MPPIDLDHLGLYSFGCEPGEDGEFRLSLCLRVNSHSAAMKIVTAIGKAGAQTAPAPRQRKAKSTQQTDLPLEVPAEPAPPVVQRSAPAVEPAPVPAATKRPGLDPAAAMAQYDLQSRGVAAPVSHVDASDAASVHYVEGGRYDGVLISSIKYARDHSFGVLHLVDGSRIKFDLVTGHTLETKNRPEADPKKLTIETTTRQGGPGAPRMDQPVEDSNGTPEGTTPDWLAPIIQAPNLAAALQLALKRIPEANLADWAVSVHDRVPAFKSVDISVFRQRIQRALGMLQRSASEAN